MTTEPRAARTLTLIGAVILILLGAGHLLLVLALQWDVFAEWFGRGLFAAVPFLGAPSHEDLAAFWAGLGSFGVPAIVLGAVILWLRARGITAPPLVGWAIAGWSVVCAFILVPSPYLVLALGGALVALGSHAARRA